MTNGRCRICCYVIVHRSWVIGHGSWVIGHRSSSTPRLREPRLARVPGPARGVREGLRFRGRAEARSG